MSGILGKKLGMTNMFDSKGRYIACTVIEAGPCVVTQVKTLEKDGYSSVQLGFGERKEKHTSLPRMGHFKKAGVAPQRKIVEFRDFQGEKKAGDVVTLDMGLKYMGMFTDSAVTLVVGGGEYNKVGQEMIDVATKALNKAMDILKPGVRTGDIGQAVEDTVKKHKGKIFKIPTILGGHGIGYGIHEDPFIPNFGKAGEGVVLKEGNVIAIEPILTENSTAMNTLSALSK